MKLSAISQMPLRIWSKNRLSILIYHRVLSKPDPYWSGIVSSDDFRSQMAHIKRFFNPIPLSDAVDRLKSGTLPSRSLAITFDDGYADNATNAVPILQELGLSATFFIATDFINGGAMWLDQIVEAIRYYPEAEIDLGKIGFGRKKTHSINEKRQLLRKILPVFRLMEMTERNDKAAYIVSKSVPVDTQELMLSDQQLIDMANAGMTIGAHTKGHPNLCTISSERAYEQISDSKRALEQSLNQPVSLFAYPFGKENQDFSVQHAQIVKELGFKAAVTTDAGVSSKSTDLFRLPRFTPWDKNAAKFTFRLATNHVTRPAEPEPY